MLARIDGSLFAERHPFRFNSMASKQVGNLLVPVVLVDEKSPTTLRRRW